MYTSTHGLAAPVTHACTQLYHISLGCLGRLPKVRAERKAVPSEILVKIYIYIPDCKISHASFVLYFHLLLLRSFIRIRSFFFISWSLVSPRTADISGRRFSPSGGREATTGNASAVRGLVLALKIEEWRNTCEDSDTQPN